MIGGGIPIPLPNSRSEDCERKGLFRTVICNLQCSSTLLPMFSDDPWLEYRRRRNLSLLAFLGFVPIFALLATVSDSLFGTATPAFVFGILWMIFVVFAGNWFIRFRCPRCGETFFAGSKWCGYNTFARRCLHCKLPLNAPLDARDS